MNLDSSILETAFYGPLKASFDPSTSTLGPLIDRATGEIATGLYRPEYLAQAARLMLESFLCLAD